MPPRRNGRSPQHDHALGKREPCVRVGDQAAGVGTGTVAEEERVDVGGVDPRTGRQELMGKFKLSDQYQLGAGVDMQGDMRMQLQYLIRFR